MYTLRVSNFHLKAYYGLSITCDIILKLVHRFWYFYFIFYLKSQIEYTTDYTA